MSQPRASASRFRLAAAALFALATIPPAGAVEPGGVVRLVIAGWVEGRAEAALEIALAPGWKTYWRAPGDAGIPPTITAAAAPGLVGVAPRFPAPRRFDEEGLTAVGYTETVLLPLDVTTTAGTRAVDVKLAVSIGLCHDICVPLDSEVEGRIDAERPVDTVAAGRIAAARARLPQPRVIGTAPEILAMRPAATATGPGLAVDVRWPEGVSDRDVLVEGPSADWALPLPERTGDRPLGETWTFALDGLPKGATAEGAQLLFTLRAGETAVEQRVTVEAGTPGK